MEKIPFQIVQNSIDKICSITEESDLETASQHLFEAQPDLGGFFMEFIEDMSEGAQDLGFMMALILNKSFEDQYKNLRPMNEDEVVARFEKNEADRMISEQFCNFKNISNLTWSCQCPCPMFLNFEHIMSV